MVKISVSVTLDRELLEWVEDGIREGKFTSISEGIRTCIRKCIQAENVEPKKDLNFPVFIELAVFIEHKRPSYDDKVLFVWHEDIGYSGDNPEELKEIFLKAFQIAHPTWTPVNIRIEPIKP